ncbi:MAG: hypothetical protein EOP84_05370 [Verrucomicrobiaceae bacterium]|nr:MAG: hypothetical protein EOP84_05370 [Verrucomicrobiaceae bacterium]
MSHRSYGLIGAITLVCLGIFLMWRWQPARQVRLHQQELLSAVEDRDWEDVGALMADDYSDRWRHDKDFVLREAREVFRQFIFVELKGEETDLVMEEGSGEIRMRLKLVGRGGPVAEFAMSRVNVMQKPWVFRWVKQSAWPWDWQLVFLDQPELELQAPSYM